MVVVAATERTRPSQGAVGELMRRPAHDVVEIGMFERMVPRAEVGQIGELGRSALGMVEVVVDLAPSGRGVAPGKTAALISCAEEPLHRVRRGVAICAGDHAGGVQEEPVPSGGRARELPGDVGVQRAAPVKLGEPVVLSGQRRGCHRDLHGGPDAVQPRAVHLRETGREQEIDEGVRLDLGADTAVGGDRVLGLVVVLRATDSGVDGVGVVRDDEVVRIQPRVIGERSAVSDPSVSESRADEREVCAIAFARLRRRSLMATAYTSGRTAVSSAMPSSRIRTVTHRSSTARRCRSFTDSPAMTAAI